MAHWTDPAGQVAAQSAGAAIGGGIGALLSNANRQKALDAVTQYAGSGEGYADAPETYVAKISEILAANGAQAGPITKMLLVAKMKDWTVREQEKTRIAEEERKKAAEAEKRAQDLARAQAAAQTLMPPGSPQGVPWVPTEAEETQDDKHAALLSLAAAAPDKFADLSVSKAIDRLFAQDKPEKKGRHVIGGRLVDDEGNVIYEGEPKPEKGFDPELTAWQRIRTKEQMGEPLAPEEEAIRPALAHKFEPRPTQEKQKPHSPLAQLIADRDALPPGHPDRRIYDEAIKKATTAGRGLRVKTTAPDGTVLEVGEGGEVEPQKTTKAKVEQNIVDTGATLQRLSILERDFDKNLQQIGPRAGAAWSALKDKGGVQLNASEKLNLQRVTSQRKRAFDVLNNELNRLSGAAISEHEMKRLSQGLPNPGTGVMDGDSPEMFQTKLKESIQSIRLAMARYAYVRKSGLSIGQIPLESMPQLMNDRGNAIVKELRAKGVPEKEATNRARAILADEFGLMR